MKKCEKHLKYVRQLPCCVCGMTGGVDPHHLRSFAFGRGMGMKSDDKWTVPLCRKCHNDVHMVGTKEEPAWFFGLGIESSELADALWKASGCLQRMKKTLMRFM